ncbi:unnamed protein product [Hermetia illucens]|uniref:Glycerate kinase n=1 Tax=Hermetia illucens TaxID=343691 RepID=A0A7R8UG27_HERIL|nr:glycerate kinase [Hermetia illucens]CAD7080180.1 unnamed protein product [Hermetia illucens]
MKKCYISDLRKVFQRAVDSVQPTTIFSTGGYLHRVKSQTGETIRVGDQAVSLENKKCHLVGFGKAVLGMAVQAERVLADRLVSGVISIPNGTMAKFSGVPEMTLSAGSVIQVHEGALNNLPDENSMQAAKRILSLAESMTNNDILFVLISGGGSALLPIPIEPITLEQKTNLIRNLARKGADIEELNVVRIAMSQTKGGKLARAAGDAYRIFSLVISDIVNDPLHLIGSGPTVEFKEDGRTARSILEKYQLWNELDANIQDVFTKTTPKNTKIMENNFVYLIGSNKIAANAALQCSQEMGYKTCILSTSIVGSLDEVVQKYSFFLKKLLAYLRHNIDERQFSATYPFGQDSLSRLLDTIRSCNPGDSLCLILAGEPTALVKGNGKGGRNQELALRMSRIFYENESLRTLGFLSAGTDGIDGPTDAAGAIGSSEVIEKFLETRKMEDLEDYLERNDSYNFYKNLGQKDFHVVTGHTGTNVMDIHLIIVPVPGVHKL